MSRRNIEDSDSEQPCEFISKLKQMLVKQTDVINFNEDGTEVIIHNEQKFTNKILKKYFRHTKWRSFVRQMNMYNFKKINRGVNTYIFVNPIFVQGNEQKYHLIRRKAKCCLHHDSESESLQENVLAEIKRVYGINSIFQFMTDLNHIKASVDGSFSTVKKSLDEIAKKRKTTDIKPLSNGIKQILQLVEESGSKYEESLNRFQESRISIRESGSFSSSEGFYENEPNRKVNKSTNLVIPEPRTAGMNNQIEIDNYLREDQNPELFPQNQFGGIQAHGSASSFTRLINEKL